jgi:hypothetical protein
MTKAGRCPPPGIPSTTASIPADTMLGAQRREWLVNDRDAGLALIVAAVAAIAAIVLFAIFSVAGEPFGLLNDATNGVFALLAGAAAWGMRDRIGRGVAVLALAGVVVAIVGSALTMTGTTGWILAGFVSSVGFGLIGPAVVATSAMLARDGLVMGRVATLGRAIGWLMALGFLAVVPSALRYDSFDATPPWAWAVYVSWFGTYFGYPAWAIASGRRLRP